MSVTPVNVALIGWGQVRHTRHRPAHHAFAYPTAFLMLPMRSLQASADGSPHFARDAGATGPEHFVGEDGVAGPAHFAHKDGATGPARFMGDAGAKGMTPAHKSVTASAARQSIRRAPDSPALALAINRWAWLAFHDADHGDARPAKTGGALAWLDELLHKEGIHDATGEVWLQAFPRVLGHTFKPVSFWYAHRAEGGLAAIVAEVNNTFGERHCYLLPAPVYGQTLLANKVFHVSPFCDVQGEYRFRFMRTQHNGQDRIVARVDHGDDDGPLIDTSWSGVLEPATAAALRRVMWRFPLLTLAVVARIHGHALLLWLKKVPFWRKPEPPRTFVTR